LLRKKQSWAIFFFAENLNLKDGPPRPKPGALSRLFTGVSGFPAGLNIAVCWIVYDDVPRIPAVLNVATVGRYIVVLRWKYRAFDNDSTGGGLAVGVMQLGGLPGGYLADSPVRGANRTRTTIIQRGGEGNG
jgi:hypothetical protein